MAARGQLALQSISPPKLQFSLSEAVCILGRDPTCDLLVIDHTVSRRHAELRLKDGELHVRDLGSRNGTFIGDRLIVAGILKLEEIVCFGAVEMALVNRGMSPDLETDDPNLLAHVRDSHVHGLELTLSRAQRRVFQKLINGLSEKAIAKFLGLSPHTVHNHTRAVFQHFGVHSRAELIALLSKPAAPSPNGVCSPRNRNS